MEWSYNIIISWYTLSYRWVKTFLEWHSWNVLKMLFVLDERSHNWEKTFLESYNNIELGQIKLVEWNFQ